MTRPAAFQQPGAKHGTAKRYQDCETADRGSRHGNSRGGKGRSVVGDAGQDKVTAGRREGYIQARQRRAARYRSDRGLQIVICEKNAAVVEYILVDRDI